MFRLLAKALFIVLPTSLLAEGTARDEQGMLSRLGYQISVDGSWGPQSQRVIGQFYTDRGSVESSKDICNILSDEVCTSIHAFGPYLFRELDVTQCDKLTEFCL
jgi:hypothetical protein